MSFYRSDSMSYYKLYLPRQSAWEIMNKLGKLNLIHVIPSKIPILNRPFVSQIKRCDDILHRIQTIERILKQKNIYQPRTAFNESAYQELFELWDKHQQKSQAHPINILNDLIQELQHDWIFYDELIKKQEILNQKIRQIHENLAIIRAAKIKFGRSFISEDQRILQGEQQRFQGSRTITKCGIINIDQQLRFKKTVFRITKGNCLVSCTPFIQIFPDTSQSQKTKAVFFILFPGNRLNVLDRKLTKIVSNISQFQYQLPKNQAESFQIVKRLEQDYTQTCKLLQLTQESIAQFLNKMIEPFTQNSFLKKYEYKKLYFIKQKQLYTNLNEMQLFNNFLQGKIYLKTADLHKLQRCLTSIQQQIKLPTGHLVPSGINQFPTYFIRNDFTRSAQQIVQTYGVANYKQANPSFFTVITFPFLFGVMFGDIGHGCLLFIFGLYLIFYERKISNSLLKMIVPHRYVLTLMGFFAIFCGFIYNDFVSLSLNLFGSCYSTDGVKAGQPLKSISDCVYPIGLDPAWNISQDYLKYVNSLKMKISVIIGVVHMTLGVFIKASNTLYKRNKIDFWFQFVPQLVFLLLIFGYMDFLIIFKWSVDWTTRALAPPSIITTMINLPLNWGKTTDCCGGQPMWGQIGNTSQNSIQIFFLVFAIISIPLMLIPKPLFLIYCKSKRKDIQLEQQRDENDFDGLAESFQQQSDKTQRHIVVDRGQPEHNKSEIMVHQLIETIQYVLGCISNTASYLRLWALSLAHSQLSDVFFSYSVENGIILGYSGIPLQVLGFVFLSGITFGVLLCMDSMQCFLHTLRLHWVQFQNKFYKGSGFSFVAFSYSDKISQHFALT